MDAGIMGDKSLLKALKNLSAKGVKTSIKRGVRAGGKIHLAEARAIAPRGEGSLRKGIVLRTGKRHRPGTFGMVVMINAKLSTLFRAASGKVAEGSQRHESGKGKVGEQYYYPAAQEFGWTRNGVHYPGRPFLRPAFDRKMPVMNITIQHEIWLQMKKEWAKEQSK